MASLTKRNDSPNWYIRYYEHGKPVWISTKKKLKGDAESVYKEWLIRGKQKGSNNIMLSELITEILKYVKLNLPASYLLYKEVLNKLLIITKDKSMQVFNITDIETYKEIRLNTESKRFKSKKISPHTVNKEVRLIKSAINKAYSILSIISHNKISQVQQLKISKTKFRKRFTRDEKDIIFTSISNLSTFKAATISRYTGMRLNEIICLQIKDLDFRSRKIMIRNKPEINFNTKSGEERDLDIGNELWSYLQEWLNLSEESNIYNLIDQECFLISYENKKYTKGYISHKFKKVLIKNKIEGNFHCLRHTFASELAESGVDIETIRSILGHSNIKTTSIYLQTGDAIKRDAMNKTM